MVEKFPEFRFPTFLQVLNRVRFLKKNQLVNRLDSLRPIYNLVACELDTIWNKAFVVPVLNSHSLATKIEKDIEKKLNHVSRNLTAIVNPNHPEKLTTQITDKEQNYETSTKIFVLNIIGCFLKMIPKEIMGKMYGTFYCDKIDLSKNKFCTVCNKLLLRTTFNNTGSSNSVK